MLPFFSWTKWVARIVIVAVFNSTLPQATAVPAIDLQKWSGAMIFRRAFHRLRWRATRLILGILRRWAKSSSCRSEPTAAPWGVA